jgi:hypothetical protein
MVGDIIPESRATSVGISTLTDKSAVHPHRCGRFNPRLARSHHRHRDTAQLRLRRWGQRAKISFDHHAGLNSEIRQMLLI